MSFIKACFAFACCLGLWGCSRTGETTNVPTPSSSSTHLQGGTVGNGLDILPYEEGTAWFSGEKPIRYCYQASGDFGASEKRIEESLRLAFARWDTYLADLGLNEPGRFPERGLLPGDPALGFAQRKWEPICDGTEELTFYFGRETPAVSESKAGYQNPVAFAKLTGPRKGFIWVQKENLGHTRWGDLHSLTAVLVHELGHVLGTAHVAGTIMDDLRLLTFLGKASQNKLSQEDLTAGTAVDQARVLLLPPTHDLDRLLDKGFRSSAIRGAIDADRGELFAVDLSDGIRLFRHGLVLMGRTPIQGEVFKMSLRGNIIASRSESRIYSVSVLHEGRVKPALLQYNGSPFQVRLWQVYPEGATELILEY